MRPVAAIAALALALALAACGTTPGPVGPGDAGDAGDAGGDASPEASADAPAGGEPGDAPGPTAAEWAMCPATLPTSYAIRSCADLPSGGVGGAQPTWYCDNGSPPDTPIPIADCIRQQVRAQMGPFAGDWINRCPLADLPPPCNCNCATQRFDHETCPGYAGGRHYLTRHIGEIVNRAAQTGRCWRR